MASVTGSRLAFFDGVGSKTVNVVLTTDGSGVLPTLAGAFNLEVFTAAPPLGTTLAPGFDGSAFIQGAIPVSGTTNEVQAGTPTSTEQLLDGSYLMVDQFGGENIQIIGSGGGGSSMTVRGSSGDTIIGSSIAGNSQLIDASGAYAALVPGGLAVGPVTVFGGAGPTTVWAGSNDSIVGGSGPMTVAGDGTNNPSGVANASNVTIKGGSGSLTTFNLGKAFSVVGSTAGTTFINDAYGGGGGGTLVGGAGASTIIGGKGDEIDAGTGALEARVRSDVTGTETINLSLGSGTPDIVRDMQVGGGGTNSTVTNFSTVNDRVESPDPSAGVGGLIATSTLDGGGNVVLHFTDGSNMTLVGVNNPNSITFIQG